ncbi:uncharacterized protein FPRO_14811 [Fusarium proliferatum ET1]|uniref:BAH domain-containing protein n=1 Tax=Fusarium proliferatum (strain ET1) TaxID=1227346 RepID=A0A1L7WAR2_FUSPR|nr:uncharacterized protein FPRO_14811 [Fusarium proliferatum ET1]CZR49711.1 uncharacterized protein FPRO_14811 [Fusarium proliferatum ET1]
MSKRKRSLPVGKDCYAECSFTISYETDRQRGQGKKKRKPDDQDKNRQVQCQTSPFNPKGNENKYYKDDFVYVSNELSLERKKAQEYGLPVYKENKDEWVARVLDIRASDEQHVYARVCWMYWPDELPAGTLDSRKKVQGRQVYHGVNELIASNHMDIINVVCVKGLATVDQWIESDTKEVPKGLYWRQAFDCRNSQLSSVELICECQEPASPDKIVLECTNPQCGKFLHEECVSHKILMQVYERLGLDKPNMSQYLAGKKQELTATHPLSPPNPEEKETRPTIDVGFNKTYDGLRCKKAAHETDCEVGSLVGGRTLFGGVATALAKQPAKKGDRKARKMAACLKPYEGLFKATLEMKDGRPTGWKILDLRESVIGGVKSWTEDVHCLLCGSVIN